MSIQTGKVLKGSCSSPAGRLQQKSVIFPDTPKCSYAKFIELDFFEDVCRNCSSTGPDGFVIHPNRSGQISLSCLMSLQCFSTVILPQPRPNWMQLDQNNHFVARIRSRCSRIKPVIKSAAGMASPMTKCSGAHGRRLGMRMAGAGACWDSSAMILVIGEPTLAAILVTGLIFKALDQNLAQQCKK